MRILALSLCLLAGAPHLFAQGTAQISGTVRDASGGVVPGSEIKATQTATGAVRTAASSADGGFVLPNLPIGPYVLEISKTGFNKYVESGLVLTVDSNPTLDITLKVGNVGEQVTVEASAAQVETHSNNIAQTVDNQRVSEMPLNGRDVHQLVFLAGMSASMGDNAGNAINTVRNYPTVVVSVAGGQVTSVGYQLDGSIYQDPYNNLSIPLPFPDALQEFKVETSALPAQYGYHGGGTVNAVTKSGTNAYHGDLFEFIRNGDLNARDFFAASRDTLKRNQWGGTIGGPVLPRFRNKLFFFAGYQRTDQRSDPSQLTEYVPTAAELQGNFQVFASTRCQTRSYSLSPTVGFVDNVISPSLLSPVVLAFAKTLPVSNDPCGKVLFGKRANLDEDLPVGRIDWQMTDKQSIFGRFSGGNLHRSSTYDGKNPLGIDNDAVHDLDYQLGLGHTYLIGANKVNSFRLSASRTNVVKIPDQYASWATFGANHTPIGGNTMTTTVSGGLGFNIGTTGNVPGQSHNGPNPSATDDFTWIVGSHQFGFGGNIYHQAMNYWSGLNAVGNQTWNGQYSGAGNTTAGLGMADLLLGQAATYSQGSTYGFYNRQYYASLYAQDSWKVTSRLTVNIGIRWEPYLSQYSKYGQIHNVSPALFAENYHSPVYTNAPAGVIFPGDPNYPCGDSFNCNNWHKFVPRVGLAYDPSGAGKTVIRAAYGQFEDRNHMFYHNVMSFGPPFGDVLTLAGINIADPWANYPGGNPIPTLISEVGVGSAVKNAPFPFFGSYVNFPNAGFKNQYLNQWNLSIQHQVKGWLLMANYLGNNTVHMTTSSALNPAVFLGLGPCTLTTQTSSGGLVQTPYPTCSTTANQNFRRVLFLRNPSQGQYYGSVGQALDSGTASYNGLNLSANRPLANGVTVLMNYTWSHCITVPFDQQTGGGVAPPGNINAYRGDCPGIDTRQVFILNAVLTSPKFANRTLSLLASDWQFAPIMQIKSGQAMNVLAGADQALTTVAGQTASQLMPNPYCPNKGIACWLNPAAFGEPALGTVSGSRYGTTTGPGLFQVDLAVSRAFRIREKQAIQIRGEAFNLPNTLNPTTPASTSRNSSVFGVIQNDVSGTAGVSGDYRVIQFAMKYLF